MSETSNISPEMIGLMAYSMATERGQINKGIELCNKALRIDPSNSDNYLYLGKLYLLSGKRDLAIKTFRNGLKVRRDQRAIEELKKLGVRKPPPFHSLPREHTLNILAGKVLRVLHFR